MVLLRPLTGRLGMRRKPLHQSGWRLAMGWTSRAGGVDARAGWSTGEHCTSMHCVGHHIQNGGCSYGAAEAPDRQAGHAPQT